MKPPAPRPQGGFSLLELLVAFAIMALALGLLYRATGGGARNAAAIELRQRATVLAESLLALRDAVPPGGWRQQGQEGEFAWSVHSAPYATGVVNSKTPPLHQLSLVISWAEDGAARELALQTLRPERRALAGERLP